jgi:hypothetical protein
MLKRILWAFGPLTFIALLGVTSGGFPSLPRFSAVGIGQGAGSAGTLSLTIPSAGQMINLTDGTLTGQVTSSAAELQYGTVSNHPITFYTNNATRAVVAASGGVTINTPTSGAALTVNAVSGSSAGTFIGNSASGNSFGLQTNGGTTSADYSFYATNQANNTQFMRIYGDGGVVIGASPTGGDKGAGTLNVQGGIYNNGTLLAVPLFARAAITGSSCATSSAVNLTCTRNSAGNYTLTLSAGYTASPVCVAGNLGTGLGTSIQPIELNVTSSTSVTVTTQSAGVITDENFYIICNGT